MARPEHLIDALIRSVKNSNNLPSEINYVPYEAAWDGADGNIKLPIVEVQPVDQIDIQDFNTDRTEFVTNNDGDRIGRRFHSEYRLRLQLDVYTAQGSEHSARSLGTDLWRALYRHDSAGPNKPLPDEDGNDFGGSWRIRVEDGEPANELTTNPALRRWRNDVVIWSATVFETEADTVVDFSLTQELL